MANKKIQAKEVGQWLLLAGGVYIGYKTLKKFGFIKTADERKAENFYNNLENKDWTNPNAIIIPPAPIKNADGTFTINCNCSSSPQNLEKWCVAMYDTTTSWTTSIFTLGILQDNEYKANQLLKQINYKSVFTKLARKFMNLYGEDLVTYLKNYFTSSDISQGLLHLENLPEFKTITTNQLTDDDVKNFSYCISSDITSQTGNTDFFYYTKDGQLKEFPGSIFQTK